MEMLKGKIRSQQDRNGKDKERKADTGEAPTCGPSWVHIDPVPPAAAALSDRRLPQPDKNLELHKLK